MRLIDLSFDTPAENLAMDEALLESVATELPQFADRLSDRYFIHTGPAQQLEAQVDTSG